MVRASLGQQMFFLETDAEKQEKDIFLLSSVKTGQIFLFSVPKISQKYKSGS